MTEEVEVGAVVSEETMDPGRCIRRSAPIAGTNVKFLSSRQKEGRFTAETAIRNTRGSESDIFFLFFFIYL